MSTTLCIEERQHPDAIASAVIPPPDAWTIARVIELLLKDQRRLDEALKNDAEQRAIIPKLLGFSIASFAVYGVVATVMLNFARHAGFWVPNLPPAYWDS